MARVTEINEGLKALKTRLNGASNRSLLDAVKIVSQGQQVIIGALNNLEKRDALMQSTIRNILEALKNASHDVLKASAGASKSKELGESLLRIESDLRNIPRTFPVAEKINIPDHNKALKAIDASLKKLPTSIPKTDLSSIEEAILELSKMDIPQTDLEPITRLLNKPKEWEFDFVYSGNRVNKVVATEIKS